MTDDNLGVIMKTNEWGLVLIDQQRVLTLHSTYLRINDQIMLHINKAKEFLDDK